MRSFRLYKNMLHQFAIDSTGDMYCVKFTCLISTKTDFPARSIHDRGSALAAFQCVLPRYVQASCHRSLCSIKFLHVRIVLILKDVNVESTDVSVFCILPRVFIQKLNSCPALSDHRCNVDIQRLSMHV